MPLPLFRLRSAVPAVLALAAAWAHADDAAIRRNIAQRLPDLPKIDEISKTPIAGVYELRFGGQVFYTDEQGNYLIEGQIHDTRSRTNLTEARLNQINAIDFAALPLKDAIVWKKGNGQRRMAVFADPNCGYCKQFERTLQEVKDVTVYTFVIPILGGDSPEKARNIWCAKDNTTAWRTWMLDAKAPARAMGSCDTAALQRNVAFSRKYHVNGTPAVVFEDGTRLPGAVPADRVEKQLALAAAAARR